MKEKHVKQALVLEATRAEITFDDGTVTVMESTFEDSQGGRGYDGGHWGPFPNFRDKVEAEVRSAQLKWGKPAATIRYVRMTKRIEYVERTTAREKFYTQRRVTEEER